MTCYVTVSFNCEMKKPLGIRPPNGFSRYETQMKNCKCKVVFCEHRESKPESADWQDLFCNYRKYYVCRSLIVSQIMPLNRDKTPAFCGKLPLFSLTKCTF